MRRAGPLFAVLALLLHCGGDPQVPSEGPRAAAPPGPLPALRASIAGPSRAPVGRGYELSFRLENASARTAYVLEWNTPLEGMLGRALRVERIEGSASRPLPYRGPLVKRGDPARSEYRALLPGETVEAKTDLAAFYPLDASGRYRVRFAGVLHDVATDATALPRPRSAHRSVSLEVAPVDFQLED